MGIGRPTVVLGMIALLVIAGGAIAGATFAVGQADDGDNLTLHEDPATVDANGGDLEDIMDRVGRDYLEEVAADAGFTQEEIEELIDDDELVEAIVSDDDDEVDSEEVADRIVTMEEARSDFDAAYEAFFERLDEYNESVVTGDEEARVENAIAVSQAAETVDTRGAALIDAIEAVDAVTDINATTRIERVEEDRATVDRHTTAVEMDEFEASELTLHRVDERGSPSDPMVVFGRVETGGDDDQLPNGTVTVSIDGDSVETEPTAAGTFRVELTPVTAQAGERDVIVRFEPDADEPYRDAEAEATVFVQQEDPTVDLTVETERAGFGDPVIASGTVTVDGDPVAGVSLDVVIGETDVGTVTTDDNGTFGFEIPIDADVPPGETEIRVAVAHEDRAVGPGSAEQGLEVTENAATIRFNELIATERAILIDGTVETDDGIPIHDQEVTVTVPEADVQTTVVTDDDGSFLLDEDIDDHEEGTAFTVNATFNASGMALQDAQATESVVVGAHVSPLEGLANRVLSPLGLAVAGLVTIGVIAAVAWMVSRTRRGVRDDRGDQAVESAEISATREVAAAEAVSVTGGIELARTVLERDPEAAIRLAYGTIRAAYADRVDAAQSVTHWEFYRDLSMRETTDTDALRELTERYERAIYAPVAVDSPGAEAAIAAAERFAATETRPS